MGPARRAEAEPARGTSPMQADHLSEIKFRPSWLVDQPCYSQLRRVSLNDYVSLQTINRQLFISQNGIVAGLGDEHQALE